MQTIKEKEYSEALAEVNFILEYTDKELVKKIPSKFMNYIETNADSDYKVNIQLDTPLEQQNLKEKTKDLMALIYRNYFCNEQERAEYDEILKKNQQEFDKQLSEKYSYENLFKPIKNEENTEEIITENNNQTALVDYNNMKWYKKIVFKITNWFNAIFKK